jgi:hypothetical protein
MRGGRFGVLSCVLLLAAGAVRGDEPTDAMALIEDAIKAHGGEPALKRCATLSRTAKGMLRPGDLKQPFTEEAVMQLPARYRSRLTLEKGVEVLLVVNDKHAWKSTGGTVFELGEDGLREAKAAAAALWMATLVPLKSAGVVLKPLPEAMLDGRPVLGVQASLKDVFDGKLWFDAETKLLVKLERRGWDAGQDVLRETIFSDHKDFAGVRLPAKILERQDGKPFRELTVTAYKPLESVDPRQFARP